jgi:hypothetical protein
MRIVVSMDKISRRDFLRQSAVAYVSLSTVFTESNVVKKDKKENLYEEVKRLMGEGSNDIVYRNPDTMEIAWINERNGNLGLVDGLPLDFVRGAKNAFVAFELPLGGGVTYSNNRRVAA